MVPYAIHLAPLQGYTDLVYREAHARVFGGVDTYYTPFVRLERMAFVIRNCGILHRKQTHLPHLFPR